jgi:hypothetical protein
MESVSRHDLTARVTCPGGLAAIGVSLPRTGFVAYQAWTDLTAPSTPQPCRRSTSPKSRCAALCGAHHAPMFARSTGGQHGKLSKG